MLKEPVIVEASHTSQSDYSLQLNRWFLKPIGAWPSLPSTPRFDRILSLMLVTICYGSIVLTAVPCILHLLLDDGTVYMKIRPLGPLSHWLVSSVNYTTLLLHEKDIRYCVEHIKSDWRMVTRTKDQQTMLKNAKLGRYVAASCAAFMQGGVLGYCLVTAMITQTIQVNNETRVIHVLPCPVYKKILDTDEIHTNEAVLLLQVWSSFIANSSTVGIFSLEAVLAAHACGQLNVLMIWIAEFVEQAKHQRGDTKFKQLGTIVEHHLRVLDFISHIEEMMNGICFLELFRSVMSLCVLSYYILMEWNDGDARSIASYFIIFVAMSFNTFIICYIGEILTEQWERVGEVVYMTEWYYLPEKIIPDLILIIVRSSAVVQFTAGKLVHLSIYTFCDVMKSAFVYMNILRQMT